MKTTDNRSGIKLAYAMPFELQGQKNTTIVAEKSLTEKKFTNRQTNIITEKAKTIYRTPYILRTRVINIPHFMASIVYVDY